MENFENRKIDCLSDMKKNRATCNVFNSALLAGNLLEKYITFHKEKLGI